MQLPDLDQIEKQIAVSTAWASSGGCGLIVSSRFPQLFASAEQSARIREGSLFLTLPVQGLLSMSPLDHSDPPRLLRAGISGQEYFPGEGAGKFASGFREGLK